MEATAVVPYSEIEKTAAAVVKAGWFGQKVTQEQVLTLMLLCQAEGKHPIEVVKVYDILPNGRASMKGEAMLAEFQARGGKVEWKETSDTRCTGIFSAPGLSKPVEVTWSMTDAKRAGLDGKQNWRMYPKQMLRWRVVTDGVKSALPAAGLGLYPTEVAQDFNEDRLGKALAVDVARAEQGGSRSEAPEEVASSGASPAEEEPPAIFEPDEHTPEEAKRLIAMAAAAPTLDAQMEGDRDEWAKRLAEKGLGQRCLKPACDGIGQQYSVSEGKRVGHAYIQCSKAHRLKQEAREAKWDSTQIKELVRGHLFAWV